MTKTAQPQQGRPPRLGYTLTDVGRELPHDMLADFPVRNTALERQAGQHLPLTRQLTTLLGAG